MMFGNVAPAPVRVVWAGPGRGTRSAAVRTSNATGFMRNPAGQNVNWVWNRAWERVGLEAHVVPVGEESPVGRELVRYPRDVARLAVGRVAGLRVEHVHAREG